MGIYVESAPELVAYNRIQKKIASDQCVILDGGIATELQRQGVQDFHLSDSTHWGNEAVYLAPHAVQAVHKSYLDAGADVLTTNTYAILDANQHSSTQEIYRAEPLHWMDMARSAVSLARGAIKDANKEGECAVAFSIGGDIESKDQLATVELLLRVFEDAPPDLVLFETLSMVNDNLTVPAIQMMLDADWPVWVSFRRCRHGACGIYGQLWGGPEGDYFGRLAQRLEQMGVGAVLLNCLPLERVTGTISWLRDFTDIPLGVYPNLGRYMDPDWKFEDDFLPEDFSELTLCWRAEGAQIIGGCCGVGPKGIESAAKSLDGISIGELAHRADKKTGSVKGCGESNGVLPPAETWRDAQGRALFPLPLPELVVDPEVFVPTQGSFLIWKHLLNENIGKDQRCLDVGCGAGILAMQLALNGAESVTAIDIQKEAVANTMTNAFRNHVSDRVKGETVDLFVFSPAQKYDLIVASLYQMPTDPKGQLGGHRAIDFWGRNLMDHFIHLLPELLAENGAAYVMQVSMLGQYRTASLLEEQGFKSKVVDFCLYDFNPVFESNLEQIQRVEALSDAYHFNFNDNHTMVMYLLEVTHR